MKNISGPVDLIKKAVSIFFEKKNLIYFLKIYLPLLPFSIFSLWLSFFIKTQSGATLGTNAWFSILNSVVNILYLIIYILVSYSGIKAVIRVTSNEKLSIKETFKTNWKLFGGYFLFSFILGIVVGFGFVLLIIPGILFSVWFAFSKFEYVKEGVGIKKSFSESKRLVKGRFFPILGRLLVFFGFIVLVQIAFAFIPYGVGGLFTPFLGGLEILPSYLLYKELKTI